MCPGAIDFLEAKVHTSTAKAATVHSDPDLSEVLIARREPVKTARLKREDANTFVLEDVREEAYVVRYGLVLTQAIVAVLA